MMGIEAYVPPSFEVISEEYLESIAPLLMSGGGWGGGGGVTPTPTPTYLNVYMLNSPDFGVVLGHGALLFESSNGSCRLYSFHPYDNQSVEAEGSFASLLNSKDGSTFEAFKTACISQNENGDIGVQVSNGYTQWSEKFKRAIRLSIPYKDATTMEALARERVRNPPQYNATLYNCQSFVNEVLAAGGTTLFSNSDSYGNIIVPNAVYSNVTRYTRGGSLQTITIGVNDRIAF